MNALNKVCNEGLKVIKALNLSRPNFFESEEVPSEFLTFLLCHILTFMLKKEK